MKDSEKLDISLQSMSQWTFLYLYKGTLQSRIVFHTSEWKPDMWKTFEKCSIPQNIQKYLPRVSQYKLLFNFPNCLNRRSANFYDRYSQKVEALFSFKEKSSISRTPLTAFQSKGISHLFQKL